VDEQDPAESLHALIAACAAAGVDTFVVHARKAWLAGLSPKENHEVPPLDHELVYRVKRENPHLTIIINGGIGSLEDAERHLAHVDGVMMGRTAYQTPTVLAEVDERLFGDAPQSVEIAISAYIAYVERRLRDGVPLNAMTRHVLGLFHGRSGARQFRRHLSENATRADANAETLRAALRHVAPRLPAAA
jgi:tRNA-dihydrouridine synthase A